MSFHPVLNLFNAAVTVITLIRIHYHNAWIQAP